MLLTQNRSVFVLCLNNLICFFFCVIKSDFFVILSDLLFGLSQRLSRFDIFDLFCFAYVQSKSAFSEYSVVLRVSVSRREPRRPICWVSCGDKSAWSQWRARSWFTSFKPRCVKTLFTGAVVPVVKVFDKLWYFFFKLWLDIFNAASEQNTRNRMSIVLLVCVFIFIYINFIFCSSFLPLCFVIMDATSVKQK